MRFHNSVVRFLTIVAFYVCFFLGIQLGQINVILTKRSSPLYSRFQDFEDVLCNISNYEIGCEPTKKIIFIKTHKTASTTVASILERYGYTRNLSFIVPPDKLHGAHILSSTLLFERTMLKRSAPPLHNSEHYDMLTNHVRYNRQEMEVVIPNATYITILRHPVKHFESSFAYFLWQRIVDQERGKVAHPIVTFLEDREFFMKQKFYFSWQAHNGQLFDLGLRTSDSDNDTAVDDKIASLNKEMDVVLIADYFDESLLILKKKLCWTMDDILYISKGVRKQKYRQEVPEDTAETIVEWNKADMKLYQHFNKTLWRHIAEYGPCFHRHLKLFRERQESVMKECTDPSRKAKLDARTDTLALRKNATTRCRNIWSTDEFLTDLIRKKQLSQSLLSNSRSE